MRCTRCGGLMVFEEFVLGSGGNGFWGRRCINCGAIVDPVIAAHRRLTLQAAASSPALTTVYGSFLDAHFMSGVLVAPRFYKASPAEVGRPSLHPGGTCLFSER
jgi:hypothetical protein